MNSCCIAVKTVTCGDVIGHVSSKTVYANESIGTFVSETATEFTTPSRTPTSNKACMFSMNLCHCILCIDTLQG